jgi:hypothetical protein
LMVLDRMQAAARANEHAQREQDESHRARVSSGIHNESVRDATNQAALQRAAQQSAEHAMSWMNYNRSLPPNLPTVPALSAQPPPPPPPAVQPHPAPPQAASDIGNTLLLSVVQELASLKALMTTPVAE